MTKCVLTEETKIESKKSIKMIPDKFSSPKVLSRNPDLNNPYFMVIMSSDGESSLSPKSIKSNANLEMTPYEKVSTPWLAKQRARAYRLL